MDVAALFRRRLRKLIRAKYRSLDRFYLESGFSKGHLSEILRGHGGAPRLRLLSSWPRHWTWKSATSSFSPKRVNVPELSSFCAPHRRNPS